MGATHHVESSFTGDAEMHIFAGLLFDMDGTIIDSTNAIIKHWTLIGEELGVDPNVILQTSHGRRSIDVLEIYDKSKANWEYVSRMEGIIPKLYGSDAVEIPGSRSLLSELENAKAPWAIVTSGTRPLVNGWLDVMKLAHPQHIVTAEDVQRGKPDPACYRLGALKLGLSGGEGGRGDHDHNADDDAFSTSEGELKDSKTSSREVLVFEDAPAGVKAGKAAGFKVVALATTHAIDQLREAGADWIVKDMRSVTMRSWHPDTKGIEIEIKDTLV